MCSGSQGQRNPGTGLGRGAQLVGKSVTDHSTCVGRDVELRVHAQIDDLGDRPFEPGAARGRLALHGPDVDALGAHRYPQRVAGPRTLFDGDDHALIVTDSHHGVRPDDFVDRHVDRVERADEVGHEGRLGMLVDLSRAADLLDAPAVHHGDPIGHRERLFLVVRDVHERRAELRLDSFELELHLLTQLHIERTERLVEEERGGLIDECPRERDPLLLSARELSRLSTLEAFELDDSQYLEHAPAVLATRNALHLETEHDVVVDRHVREECVLLEDHVHGAPVREDRRDVAPLEQDPAGVGHFEPGDHPQRRRLAAAARPEKREELALTDRERDVSHGLGVAKALAHALKRDSDALLRCHAGRV